MAERDGADIFRRHPHIDILCGPGELDKLAGMVHNAVVTQTPVTRRYRGSPAGRQVALMGANVRRSGTLDAAEDHLELLDLSRSIGPADDVVAGLRADHARLQQVLHLLRRALHPRPGGAPPAGQHHRRGAPPGRRRQPGSHAARADDQPLRLRPRRRPHDHVRRPALPDPRSGAAPAAAAVRHQLPARLQRRRAAGDARLPAHLPLSARPGPERIGPRS